MTAPKVLSHFGLLAQIEAAYNTYLAPAAADDGLAIIERPEWDIDYVDHGERNGRAPGTVLGLKRVAKTGRFARLSAVMQPAGLGAAYGASTFPNIHALMRAAGYSVTTDVTALAEKQTYLTESAVAVTPASLSLLAYDAGEEAKLAGAFVDEMTYEVENGRVPRMTFGLIGTMDNLPQDLALPAITYAGSQIIAPAKATGLDLTLAGVTPTKVRSLTIRDARNIGARMLDNATGNHGGFTVGAERNITATMVIEALALATLNPYELESLLTAGALEFAVGATQYNRHTVELDNVQVVDIRPAEENNARAWEIDVEAKPSTLTAYDALRFIFD